MRRLVTLIIATFIGTSILYAGSGSAIIPRFKLMDANTQGPSVWTSNLYLSNVTSSNVDVYIKFYSMTGTLITDSSILYTSYNITDLATGTTESVSFSIGSHNTALLMMAANTNVLASNLLFGYGVVEWDQGNSANPVCLIGDISTYYKRVYPSTNTSFGFSDTYRLNDGNPF